LGALQNQLAVTMFHILDFGSPFFSTHPISADYLGFEVDSEKLRDVDALGRPLLTIAIFSTLESFNHGTEQRGRSIEVVGRDQKWHDTD
jgi:hypothetical protein